VARLGVGTMPNIHDAAELVVAAATAEMAAEAFLVEEADLEVFLEKGSGFGVGIEYDDDDDGEMIVLMEKSDLELLLLVLGALLSVIVRFMRCQRFLIALSVRPGRYSAIFVQWLPTLVCIERTMVSSSGVQQDFFRSGDR
jgi:hypothetical protein